MSVIAYLALGVMFWLLAAAVWVDRNSKAIAPIRFRSSIVVAFVVIGFAWFGGGLFLPSSAMSLPEGIAAALVACTVGADLLSVYRIFRRGRLY